MNAVDTETQAGRAVLVCTPEDALVRPRSFGDTLEWLEARGPDFVAWNADYDIQAILRLHHPYADLRELGLTTRAELEGWSIHYVPTKYLRARRGKRRVAIYDAMQFFGAGLDSTARKILGVGKTPLSPRVRGYIERGAMGDALRDPLCSAEVVDYCKVDALRTREIWERLAASLATVGVDSAKPASPASLARRYWQGVVGRPRLLGREPIALRAPAAEAYRGGRIETLARGYFPRLYRHDIRSAYPSVMVDLPAVDDCDVCTESTPRADAAYGLFLIDVTIPREGLHVGPMAVLHNDVLVYPAGRFRDRWVDLATMRLLLRWGYSPLVRMARQFIPRSDARPFASMRALYRLRKERPDANYAVKILLNGTYGLLAEQTRQIGRARTPRELMLIGNEWYQRYTFAGSAQSFLAAGQITGAVRARLVDELRPYGLVTTMTDGAMTREPAPESLYGPDLGDWDAEGSCAAVVVGGGLYSTAEPETSPYDDTAKWKDRIRGWARLDLVRTLRETPRNASKLRLETLVASTIRECALGYERWSAMNDLTNVPRVLRLGFDVKRAWERTATRDRLLTEETGSRPLVLYD